MITRLPGTTPALARSRAIGAIFLTGFGALWLWLGAVNASHGSVVTLLAVLAPAAFGIALALRLRRLAPAPEAQPQAGRVMGFFVFVNIVQYLAIAAAVFALIRLGQEDYLPAVIALIVGLHFLPLAWLFRNPIQYATAAAMVAIALVARTHYIAVFLATGAILWATAGVHLLQAARLTRPLAPVSQPPST